MDRLPLAALAACLFLAACKPPASDAYEERASPPDTEEFASEPIASPDAEDAVWAPSETPLRLLYGVPGQHPFAAIACEMPSEGGPEQPQLRMTRFVRADEGAQALMALIGNGHKERFAVQAVDNGRAYIWEGTASLEAEKLDVLTGGRKVELTIPGAGTLVFNESDAPRDLIETCRLAMRKSAQETPPNPE